jgi:hypothetical protein
MILARPQGRGNWKPMLIQFQGDRAAPLLVKVGELFSFGGIVWRVVEVRP